MATGKDTSKTLHPLKTDRLKRDTVDQCGSIVRRAGQWAEDRRFVVIDRKGTRKTLAL
jgi:hypothetical protein